MLALSLDMGGTHIGCAVVLDRTILADAALPSGNTQDLVSLLPAVEKTLRQLLADSGIGAAECAGMAIGFPGIVDARTGCILSTLKKYDDAIDLNLAQWCEKAFGVPLRVENDARMALLGEQYAGAAQGIGNVVMMTLGTGIGTAAMIEGKLLRGVHAQGAILGGHLPLNFHGRLCSCGNIGCGETEAAGWSLPEIVREWPGFERSSLAQAESLDFRSLFAAAALGDAVAIAVRQRCLDVWAAEAVALIHAYDPEVVVIGGGVMRSAEAILPHMRRHVAKHAWTAWGKPQIRVASLCERAALLGAIPLLGERF